MKTRRQRHGTVAETQAVGYLEQLGWRVLMRNLRVGRDEIDVLATDPGPPATLVVVEVRSLRAAAFGEPEERVDRAKVRRLYRAVAALGSELETGEGLGRLPRRVDLVIVDGRWGTIQIRHLRSLEPP